MRKKRALAWVKDGPVGVEFAEVLLESNRLSAIGVALGSKPVPYRLDYGLLTHVGYATSRLRCDSRGDGWHRSLDLQRSKDGRWHLEASATGVDLMPPPGGLPDSLADAMDCDLGLSPLTNTLPVLRQRMAVDGGSFELIAAWVSVPDLQVVADAQRYVVVDVRDLQAVIRYEAGDGSFAADITFDEDGIVLDYPGIARRL